MVELLAEETVVSKAVPSSARSLGHGILQRTTHQHHKRGVGEVLEVPLDDCDLVGMTWIIHLAEGFHALTAGGIPFPPAADGSDVHVINIG
jgi:hypothetical protein